MHLPKWLYGILAALAILVAAGKLTLVGRVTWLKHESNAEAYLDFGEAALLLAGFGSFMRRPTPVSDEPMELPPIPKAGEQ